MNLPKASVTVMLGDDVLLALTDDNRVHATVDAGQRAIVFAALGRAATAMAHLIEQGSDFDNIRAGLVALERIGTPEALALRADLDAKLKATIAAAQDAAALVATSPNNSLN